MKRRERGQTMAEFVVVLPFLLLLFFLIVDFGWLLKTRSSSPTPLAARCTVAVSCQLNGADTTPSLLAEDRINAGITGNLTNVAIALEYIDADRIGGATAGDGVVVSASADTNGSAPFLACSTGRHRSY
jgi:Flp pilus assembly protein TadG